MQNLLYSYMIAQPHRFHFTDRDRKENFSTIFDVMKLVHREKNLGRLNLEEDAYGTENFFLKKALYLFIDNVEHSTVNEILETYITFGEYEGKELLEKLIILDGIRSLYKGDPASVIEEKLCAYIGEKFYKEYGAFRDKESDNTGFVFKHEPREPEYAARNKFVPEPIMDSNSVLSQSDIDKLLAQLLS